MTHTLIAFISGLLIGGGVVLLGVALASIAKEGDDD